MSKSLHIVVTADPEIPVPPKHYGGVERIVQMVVEELFARGHRVTLFASAESKVECELVPFPGPTSSSPTNIVKNALALYKYIKKSNSVDVIHSFGRLAYLLPLLPNNIPKIQSYGRDITRRNIVAAGYLSRGSFFFTGCSHSCAETAGKGFDNSYVIPNGIMHGLYDYVPEVAADAPLVFLGRVERIKGAHTAIEVAKRVGRKLLIAGNHADSGPELDYFQEGILPRVDGESVIYLGPVDDKQKNELLGQAAALLFPIEWEEPFGIVMAEALACGTPVIAFPRGAVPEVIEHGKTGFICRDLEEMVDAVGKISQLNRYDCRKSVEKSFSADVITRQYEELYYSLIEKISPKI